MNLTTEQIEQILDGAFDEELGEFTLVVRNRLYKRDGKGWLSKRLDGTGLTNKLQPNTKNVQNISDLREILTLRQRVQELEYGMVLTPCYECGTPVHELSPRSRCCMCEYGRANFNERENNRLREKCDGIY